MTVPTSGGIDLLARYDAGGFYDELLGADDEHSRAAEAIRQRLASFQIEDLRLRSEDAEREFHNLGITFLILTDREAIDRILPFDVVPRVITVAEWERLNAGAVQRVAVLNHFLHDIHREQKALKNGIIEGPFYRDQGWYFYHLGKNLERADQTTRLVDIKYHALLPTPQHVGTAVDEAGWNAMLRSAAGYHAYRRVFPRGMQPAKVAELLVFDEDFPRSPAGCMAQMNRLLTRLKSRYHLSGGNSALERLDEIDAMMATEAIESAVGTGLHEFLDFLQRQFIRLTNELEEDFFGYAMQVR